MNRPANLPISNENAYLLQEGRVYEDDDTIDLVELVKTLYSYRYLIITISIIVPILTYGALQFIPKKYTATTTFIQIGGNDSGSKLAQFGALAAIAGVSLSGGDSGQLIDKIEVILKSREFSRLLVNELNLMPIIYPPDQQNLEPDEEPPTDQDAAEYLMEAMSFEQTPEGADSIKVTLEDPEYSAYVANQSLVLLEGYLKENTLTSSQKNIKFIEEQIKKAEVDLRSSEEKLRNYVMSNQSYLLSSQTEIIGRTLGELEVKKSMSEVEQVVLRQFRSGDAPQIQQMRLGNEALQTEIKRLRGELSGWVERYGNVQFEEAFLKKELEVYQEVYKQLRVQYETQKLEVEKERTLFKVLDPALVPEHPSSPRSLLILALSFIVAGFFSVFLVFFIDFIKKLKANPS